MTDMCCRCARQIQGCLLDIHSTDFCVEVQPRDSKAAKTIQLDLAAQMRALRDHRASYLRYLVLARLIKEAPYALQK